jgi:hypothetical protein
MNSRFALYCSACIMLLAIPSMSHAQGGRYGRSGVVYGPDGALYNTRSPEWRMSGGNIFVYQQLMEQKMMLQQQRLMMRQQIQQQKLMRQRQQGVRNDAGRDGAEAAINQNGAGANNLQNGNLSARRRRKAPGTAGANAPAAATRRQVGATTNADSEPASKSGSGTPAPEETPNSP